MNYLKVQSSESRLTLHTPKDAIVDVLSITTASEKYPHMPVTFRVALLLETQQGLSTESLQLVRQVVTSPGLGEVSLRKYATCGDSCVFFCVRLLTLVPLYSVSW